MAPAVGILDLAELDAGETLVEGVAGRSDSIVRTEDEAPGNLLRAEHGLDVDARHRRDDDSRTAGAGLLEGIELVKRYGALLDGHAEVLGDRLQALVGDGRQHAVRERGDVFDKLSRRKRF